MRGGWKFIISTLINCLSRRAIFEGCVMCLYDNKRVLLSLLSREPWHDVCLWSDESKAEFIRQRKKERVMGGMSGKGKMCEEQKPSRILWLSINNHMCAHNRVSLCCVCAVKCEKKTEREHKSFPSARRSCRGEKNAIKFCFINDFH